MADPLEDLFDSPAPTKRRAPNDYKSLYQEVGTKHGVDPDLLYRQAKQESSLNPRAVGPPTKYGTAKGMAQFIPTTAREYGMVVNDKQDDRLNPEKAADAQARLMRKLIDRYKGDERLALSAYNSGTNRSPQSARRAMERIPETRNYVQKITGGRTQRPTDPLSDLFDAPEQSIKTADPIADLVEPVAQPVVQPTPRPVRQKPAGGRGAFYANATPQRPVATPVDPRAILGLGGKVTPANLDVVTPVRQAVTAAGNKRARPLSRSEARRAGDAEIELMRRTAEEVKREGGSVQNQDPYAILPVNKNADHEEVMRRVGTKVQRHGSAADAMEADTRNAQAEKSRQERVAKMGMGEKLAQVPKSAVGAVYGTVGEGLKGIAVLGKKAARAGLMGPHAGEAIGEGDTKDSAIYRTGEDIISGYKEIVGSNPDLEKELAYGKAPAVIGQVATVLLGGAATKAPRVVAMIMGGTMNASSAYDEVRASGGTEDEAVNGGLWAAGLLTPTELLGMHGITQVVKGTAKAATLRTALKESLQTGTRDSFENALQGLTQEAGMGAITGNPRTGKELLESAALEALAGTASVPMSLASKLPTGGKRARETDQVENLQTRPEQVNDLLTGQPASAELQGGQRSVGDTVVQRFQHPELGEVQRIDGGTPNKGKVLVESVSDPSKVRYVKESELTPATATHPAVPLPEEGVRSAATTPSPASGERRITPFADRFADVTDRVEAPDALKASHDMTAKQFVEKRVAQRRATKAETSELLDEMTGLPNQKALIRATERAKAGINTTILSSDVRNLKAANELLGREAGNQAIKDAADAMRQAAQEHGVNPERHVFRDSGDEIIAHVPNEKAEAIRARAKEIFQARKAGDYDVGIDIGAGQSRDLADAHLKTLKTGESFRPIKKSETPADVATPETWEPGKVLSGQESQDLVQKIRAGDPRSKNEGRMATEPAPVGRLQMVELPVDEFSPSYLAYLRESTNADRVARYVKDAPDAPVYATPGKRGDNAGKWTISDGGHRVLAAVERGDKTVRALVPEKTYTPKSPYDMSRAKVRRFATGETVATFDNIHDAARFRSQLGKAGIEYKDSLTKKGKAIKFTFKEPTTGKEVIPEGQIPSKEVSTSESTKVAASENLSRPAEVAATASAPKGTELATQELFVEIGGKRHPFTTPEDASARWADAVDEIDARSSESGIPRIVTKDGTEVGHISYNGRIWEGSPDSVDAKIVYDPAGILYPGDTPMKGNTISDSMDNPIMVYRGRLDELPEHGGPYFFSQDRGVAGMWAGDAAGPARWKPGTVTSAHLTMDKPFKTRDIKYVQELQRGGTERDALIAELKAEGHDGVIYDDMAGDKPTYIVFDKSQIKERQKEPVKPPQGYTAQPKEGAAGSVPQSAATTSAPIKAATPELQPLADQAAKLRQGITAPELSSIERSAMERKAKRLETAATGVELRRSGADPYELLDDIIIKGGELYRKAKPAFEEWAKSLKGEFGPEAEQHLKNVYSHLTGEKEGDITLPDAPNKQPSVLGVSEWHHGTSALDAIEKEGRVRSRTDGGTRKVNAAAMGEGVYINSDLAEAQAYVPANIGQPNAHKNGVVSVGFTRQPKLLEIDVRTPEGNAEFDKIQAMGINDPTKATEYVKSRGYEGVAWTLKDGTQKAVVYDSSLLSAPKVSYRSAGPSPEPSTTAANRAKVTADRAARGEEAIPKPERKADTQLLDDAKAANEADKSEPMRLADQVLNGKKGALSDKETVQLDLHVQELKNKYDAVNKELAEARTPEQIAELGERSDAMEREMRIAEEAWAASGTEKGRALRAQRMEIDQDFRLLTMVSKATKARGKELTPEERATVKEQSEKIADLEVKLKEATDRAVKAETEKAANKIKEDVARENRRGSRTARKGSLDDQAAQIRQQIAAAWAKSKTGGSEIHSAMGLAKLDPEGVVTKLVVELAKNRIQAHVGLKAEALVDQVHGLLKDTVDLSRRDVAEMISGYGKTFQMSQDAVDVRLRELKSIIASNLGKADIIEKGIRPLRRGLQRDKPSQEVREAMRDLKDTLKEHGMRVEREAGSPEEQQKSRLDAAKTQTRNRIEDLNKWISDGRRTVANKVEIIPDAELSGLRAERDRLQTTFDAIVDPVADQRKIGNALRSANKSVAELEAKLKSGDLSRKTRGTPLTSPELEAARAQQKALRGILNDLRNAGKPPADPVEVEARKLLAANKALNTRMERQITDFERRLLAGDFSAPPKREAKVYNTENLRLQKQLEQIKQEYMRANYKATRGRGGMVLDEIAKAGNLPKTLKSMGDISAVLRQGGFYSLSHPVEGLLKPSADMIRSFTEAGHENVKEAIKRHPKYDQAKRDGVEFTGVDKNDTNLSHREEGFFGGETIDVLAKGRFNVPGKALKAVKGFSERTFVSFLDSQRMNMYDLMTQGLEAQGLTPRNAPESYKGAAKLINIGTGRGNLGKTGNQAAPLLNIAMFSPRLVASRVQLLNNMFNPVAMARKPKGIREQNIKDNVKFLAATSAFMGLATALGATVNRDPDDADFLKIRFGKTTYDTLTGLQQPMRYIINMGRAATGGETYPGQDMGELTKRFARSKASPLAGLTVDAISGEDFQGRKFSAKRAALDVVTPLPVKDFREAMEKEGLLKGFAKALPATTGIGVQTYDARPEKATTHAEKLTRKLIRAKMPDTAREDEEIEVDKKRGDLRARSRKGEDVNKEVGEMLKSGTLSREKAMNIIRARNQSRFQEDIKHLGADDALTVYRVMSADERKVALPIILSKIRNSEAPVAQKQKFIQKARQLGVIHQ